MPVSVQHMNTLAEKIADLRAKETEASNAKKVITQELEVAENEMLVILQENNLTSYRAPAGLCSLAARTSVKLPQGELKLAFYQFLKDKGYYDDMISVNSQKLNSFYKEQFELAKERGDDDFEIPGITEVTITPNLSFRRG